MKNKKGFTLVELLAVIVILAVILIIAIPQIMDTIKTTRLKTMEDSAKLIATNAEKDYLAQQTINQNYNVESIPCSDVAKLSDDYESCSITYSLFGREAIVKLKGASGGKFNNMQCFGTKDNMDCWESTGDSNWIYAFGNITNLNNGEEDYRYLNFPVFIKFNKNDLNEKYVCTTFGISIADEPTCISANAYNNYINAEDKTNTEWYNMKRLFGEARCTEASYISCHDSSWGCSSGSYGATCYYDHGDYASCNINAAGSINCTTMKNNS